MVSLLIEQQSILKIEYKIHFLNLSLHKIDSFHFISLEFIRVATLDFASALTLRGHDL
jgi:hypothetical protein